MEKISIQRITEITIEKLIFALVVAAFSSAATFWTTRYMERFKVAEALRGAEAAEFVKACAEIWGEVAKYEDLLDKATDLRIKKQIFEWTGGGKDGAAEQQIAAADTAADQQSDTVMTALSQRRYVISQNLTLKFAQYVGLARAHAGAVRDAKTAESDEMRHSNEEAAKAFEAMLSNLRFDATAARQAALAKNL